MSVDIEPPQQAVILAAGRGSRLRGDTPKPLLEVLGVPLLARTLYTLRQAGITDFVVVLGYRADDVRRGIEPWIRPGMNVRWVVNPEWQEPNGVSVLASEPFVEGPFFLTMTDHVFRPEVAEALSREGAGQGLNLAVDYRIDSVLDLDDATKVRVEQGRIGDIGKTLERYSAIDTGVFLATPALFDALRDARAEGDASLSGGVRKLAARGRARVTDVRGQMWQDVDTPEDMAVAEQKLLAGLRKASDGPVSRFINRPLSTRVSRWLVRTPVTPNQISVAAMIMSLAGAGFVAVGGYLNFLLGAGLFQLASVVDGMDGEVAKLKFQQSRQGEWVDTVCDNVSYIAFLAALIFAVARSALPPFYVQLGVVGLVAATASIGNLMSYVAREGRSGSFLSVRYGYQHKEDWLSAMLRVVQFAGKRDFFSFAGFTLALVGHLPLALPIFGASATLLLLPLTVKANLASWIRQRRAPTELTSSEA
ncbi:MAG: NTP transferase domain-containing protein [Longimicrobiales bacterium]|nr:NTP transferase domain-containing protein [Longimicrobiales bacterium]